MPGMDETSGLLIGDEAHLAHSLRTLLTTPKGSRVMRRDYGIATGLVDAPANRALMIEVTAAVAEAVDRWEPRFELRRVLLESAAPGRVSVALEGVIRGLGPATIPATLLTGENRAA